MRVLRVSEFRQWLDTSGCRDFLFDSGNSACSSGGFELCQHFTGVQVSNFYDKVLFRNTSGTLLLSGVKEVHMSEGCSVGTVFDIVCVTPEGDAAVWRFLAD